MLHIAPESHLDHVSHLGTFALDRLFLHARDALEYTLKLDDTPRVLVVTFELPGPSERCRWCRGTGVRPLGGTCTCMPVLTCDLLGPSTTGEPVLEADVTYEVRPGRRWASRLVYGRPPVRASVATIIVGPHGEHPHTLYTIHGGPAAPREPGDPSISSWDELVASRVFWTTHALGATP